MRLSPHFTLGEMTRSETALRHKIANVPNKEEVANLKALCVMVLEKIRGHFKAPIHVSSGYRCRELNLRVGGSARSQHVFGQAADFEVSGMDHLTVARWIVAYCDFDQLIIEYCSCEQEPTSCQGWLHVSYRARDAQNRKAVLQYRKGGGVLVLNPSQIPKAA